MIIKKSKKLQKLVDNRFVGILPKMRNSEIVFCGKNNILYCEKGVNLVDSKIVFAANDSIVYLSRNRFAYKLEVNINNNSNLYIGKNNYFNHVLKIILSEQKNCIIGNECLFSSGIVMRNADAHLIYDINTKKRINNSKSIYVGDHVWIGQNCLILKGTEIDSGSIIGGMSVISGKKIKNNQLWAGNPCRMIKNKVFWNSTCVHKWTLDDTLRSQKYDNVAECSKVGDFIFEYSKKQCIKFEDIEKNLARLQVKERLSYIQTVFNWNYGNRFVHYYNK